MWSGCKLCRVGLAFMSMVHALISSASWRRGREKAHRQEMKFFLFLVQRLQRITSVSVKSLRYFLYMCNSESKPHMMNYSALHVHIQKESKNYYFFFFLRFILYLQYQQIYVYRQSQQNYMLKIHSALSLCLSYNLGHMG